MLERVAICPGSFDPVTNGHLAIMRRGLALFDRVIVAVAINISKRALFSYDERVAMIRESFSDEPRLVIESLQGLLTDYADTHGAIAIIRGLRGPSDLAYEMQMAQMNRHLKPDLDTVFLASDSERAFVSSSLVREVASLGGDASALVPPHVWTALNAKLKTP